MKYLKNIMDIDYRYCACCNNPYIEMHHIFFGTANRRKSEKFNFKIPLCAVHHRGNDGVHFNRELDLKFKCMAQEYYEERYGTRADFIIEFGRNYL